MWVVIDDLLLILGYVYIDVSYDEWDIEVRNVMDLIFLVYVFYDVFGNDFEFLLENIVIVFVFYIFLIVVEIGDILLIVFVYW